MKFALFGFMFVVAMEYLGLGYQFPILQKLFVTTIFPLALFTYVLVKYGLSEFMEARQIKILIVFVILTGLSGFHGLVGTYAIAPLKSQIGYLLVLATGFYVLRTHSAIVAYFWFMAALHMLAVIINLEKFSQAAREGGFRNVGYFLGDGNDFGWSLVITFSMSLFLLTTSKGILTRLIAAVPTMFVLMGIVGTKSRGATLALSLSMFYYLLFISKRKFLGLFALAIVAAGIFAFAPDDYFDRMETLSTYEEDTSATGRLRAWGHAIEMAVDHPFLGVGAGSFNSAYGRYYRGAEDPQRWISTHSVYFRVLAEYGFIGIILFLSLILTNFIENQRTARLLRTSSDGRKIPYELPLFVNMSLIGYAVAGTFLSGVEYPHIFLITAITMAVKRLAQEQESGQEGGLKKESG